MKTAFHPDLPIEVDISLGIAITRCPGKIRKKFQVNQAVLSFGLSGGFTPCRHLRPSSGREHTIV